MLTTIIQSSSRVELVSEGQSVELEIQSEVNVSYFKSEGVDRIQRQTCKIYYLFSTPHTLDILLSK